MPFRVAVGISGCLSVMIKGDSSINVTLPFNAYDLVKISQTFCNGNYKSFTQYQLQMLTTCLLQWGIKIEKNKSALQHFTDIEDKTINFRYVK